MTGLMLGLIIMTIQPVRADGAAGQLQAIVDKQSPSIVSVKAVIKTEMKGGGSSQAQESRMNLQGVIVDPDGLIMVSNTPFSPNRIMEMFGGGGGDAEG